MKKGSTRRQPSTVARVMNSANRTPVDAMTSTSHGADDRGVQGRLGPETRPGRDQPAQRSRTTSSRSGCRLAVAIRVLNRSMAVSS